jgi:hypothetical protein
MPAYLVVRAVVPEADRAEFDRWYREEHLPDAKRALAARAAWRAWSVADPAVHCAFYRFDNVAAAQAATTGDAIKALVAEFDRCWGSRVTRSRDILDVADELEGTS